MAWTTKFEVLIRVVALIVGIFIISLLKANAQNWVEERTFVSQGAATPRINGLLTKPIKGKWGSFLWFQTQQKYSQTYTGVTHSAKPHLQFALGVGLEEAKNPARMGGYVWAGNSKTSLLFVPEYGGSGFWWKLEANQKIRKSFGIGLLTERFKGTGPRMEYKIPRTPFVVWVAPLIERQKTNWLIGIRLHL